MSLNYEKTKARLDHGQETVWISYSDLATVLTVLFLMLYAVSTSMAEHWRKERENIRKELAGLKKDAA